MKSKPIICLRVGVYVLVAVLGALTLSNRSFAAKIYSSQVSSAAIEACLVADDSRVFGNSTHAACCSKSAGICVICPHIARPDNGCHIVNYRANALPNAAIIAPQEMSATVARIRAAVQQSSPNAIAPPKK